ncbi:MAG: lysylphosphatidylglycerol synthase transmembrane domain-containing protein [Haloarculaceae archaeon]
MSRRVRLVAGFALAFLAVGGFLWAVGPGAVLAEFATADLPVLALGFLSVLVALACWSEAVRRLVSTTGHPVRGVRYRLAYLSGEFLKQVLPMGQSGGPVLMAYTISRESEAPYEPTMAAASVFAFLNVVASLVLAVAGLALLVATRRGPTGTLLWNVLVAMVAVTGLVLALSYLAVYRRPLLERVALRAAAVLRRVVGRVSARADAALAPVVVGSVVRSYTDSVGQLAGDRRSLGVTVGLAVTGWLFFLVPLYTSFLAIDDPVPYALVVFAVPVVTLLNVVPLPGGLGGFEAALAAVTAAVGTLELSTATAAVFLFRLSNYWFLVLVGGLAALALSVRVTDPPSVVTPPEDPDTLDEG